MRNLIKYSPVLLVMCILIADSRIHAQPANLVLRDTTIAGVATFIATNSIAAGPNFTIASTGDATFKSGGTIYLRNGIVVVSGGRFRATKDSTLLDVKSDKDPLIPAEFALRQNYPNPFNPATTFAFDVPRSSMVVLMVHNVLGQQVATLVNEILPAGRYSRTFDARGMASGVYFYRLSAGEYSETKRMMLVK